MYERCPAARCARRTIERRVQAVARGVELAAAEVPQLLVGERVEARLQLLPVMVAELSRVRGRVDDVAEENRGQHAVRLWRGPLAGHEFAYFGDDRVGVA